MKKNINKMHLTVQLEQNLPDMIGKNVSRNEENVGKIVDYNPDSGVAEVEIVDKDLYEITDTKYVGISSRKKN